MLIQKLKLRIITTLLPQSLYVLWKMKRNFFKEVVKKHYTFIDDKNVNANQQQPIPIIIGVF